MTEATRRLLLDAGRRTFARQGLDGARVEAIAREAGVNKALINYHFRGKQGLYEAVLAELLSAASQGLADRLADIESPAERLRAWPRAQAELLKAQPDLSPLLLGEWLRAAKDAAGEGGPLPGRELMIQTLAGRPLAAEPLLRLIMGGVLLAHLAGADPLARDAALEDGAALMELLIAGSLLD